MEARASQLSDLRMEEAEDACSKEEAEGWLRWYVEPLVSAAREKMKKKDT